MSETHVRVICRFRPVNQREQLEAKKKKISKKNALCIKMEQQINTISVKLKSNSLHFVVDEILSPETTQDECFRIAAEPTVRDILRGYNGTIFAYGQTGSGKTHSMYGPEGQFCAKESGMVPRAISMLFQSLEDNDNILEFTLKVSFLEIYLESMRDLLNIDGNKSKSTKKGKKKGKKVHKSAKEKQKEKDANKLRIRTYPNGSTIIQNLYEEECDSLMDVLGLIQKASQYRTTSSTTMNATSSRSHLVMMTHIQQKMQDGSTRLSRLNFADLAGSEKVKKTGASGIALEEAKQINKSLTHLGIVIRALSEKKSFISYRDSTLTHILKDSLGGNTKTTLLCTMTPHIFNRDESISTLRFATRAKLISNIVYKNTVLSAQQMTKLIKNLRREIVGLKHKLQDKVIKELIPDTDQKEDNFAMEKSAMNMDPAMQKQMISDLKNYKSENIKLQQEDTKWKLREDELQKIIAQLRSEIEDWKEKHQNVLLDMDVITTELEEYKSENITQHKLIVQLQEKITELNAQLLQSSHDKNKSKMQLEFLSAIYQNKLKRVQEEEKEMDHQLSLIHQHISKNKQSVLHLQNEMGDMVDTKIESKVIGLQNETLFYEEQETRLQEVLRLFQEEKSLLLSKDDTLTQQLKNLQKYLDLKDRQIDDLRAQLNGCDDKLKLKELQNTRQNTTIQHLNDTMKHLQDENASLEKKVKAYFTFNDNHPSTPRSPMNGVLIAPWEQHRQSRGRHNSAFRQSDTPTRKRSGSDHKEDGDNLLKQQEYLAEFARLRAQREKERLEAERQRRKKEQEDALKKQKAEEIARAAAERERKLKQQKEAAEAAKIKKKKEQEAQQLQAKKQKEEKEKGKEKLVKKKRNSVKTKKKKKEVAPWLKPNPRDKEDKDTLNTYRRSSKKVKRWKSSRSKVQALISGFEQVEDEEDVFGETDVEDDATMMLRMLDNMQSQITEADPRKWSVDDVVTWLKSIDLSMYTDIFRRNKIDGSILYNDIVEITHLTDLKVAELHANKLLREINMLRVEQRNAELDDIHLSLDGTGVIEEETKMETVTVDPFEMIRELFMSMDKDNNGYIDRDNFDFALEIASVTTLSKAQVDMVYNQFHFSSAAGITEEEMLLCLGKIFVQHHCTDAKMAFRLACVLMLQSTGMIAGYADNLEDLFENVAEVQKNLIEWQENSNGTPIVPFFEEKLMKLMKVAGSRVCIIDGKRIKTTEEFDDMHCARMAGDGVHLSVIKVWWAFSTVHGIQSTYTSMDGKHFTSIRHGSNIVADDKNDSLHETIILLKHDEFIKYVSVSATYLVHNITVVTTLGKRYECGNNRGDEIIQYKPPVSCGILAFYGSVTHRGLSAIGTYVVKNEKTKLKMTFKKAITTAHNRAKLRQILKGKLNKGINLEEAIGYVVAKYDELNVRRICEATDKDFVKQVSEECNKICQPESINRIRSQRRKLTLLTFEFNRSPRKSSGVAINYNE